MLASSNRTVIPRNNPHLLDMHWATLPSKVTVMPDTDTPSASSPAARDRMRQIHQKCTGPEIALRLAIHKLGLRFFTNRPPIPGDRRTADIIFPGIRLAVYMDGCFWHGCPSHGSTPKTNGPWWAAKIENNKHRDLDTERRLRDAGWIVLRFWEHDDPYASALRVQDVVRSLRSLKSGRI